MRVLFVTAAAPPAGGSHATRIAALIQALVNSGSEVTLLTVAWPEDMITGSSLYRRLQLSCRIVHVSGGVSRRWADAIRQGAEREIGRTDRRRWFSRFLMAGRRIARLVAIPDSFVGWIPRAAAEGKRLVIEGCDLVVSSGAPFSSHLAATIIARRAGLPLVLDYGDPWVYEPGRPRQPWRHFVEVALERWVVKASSAVCVTTEATRRLYEERFGLSAGNIHVVPMGFNAEDFAYDDSRPVRGSVVRFVYAGRINDEYRSLEGPQALISTLQRAGVNFHFDFYGGEDMRLQRELGGLCGNVVRSFSALDYAAYVDLLRSADYLMVLGNNNLVQIPGKIAHVLAARRPIVYFANVLPLSDDPALQVMRRVLKRGLYVVDGPTGLDELVDALSPEAPVVDECALRELSWDSIGEKFIGVLEVVGGTVARN